MLFFAYVKPHTRPLRSAPAGRFATPSLRGRGSTNSPLFAVPAPQSWNQLPTDIRAGETQTAPLAHLKYK